MRCIQARSCLHSRSEHYVTLFYAQGMKRTVVQREANILDLNDCKTYEGEVQQSMLEELQRWLCLGAIERMPKHLASNVIYARWVFKVKQVDDKWRIQARLKVSR